MSSKARWTKSDDEILINMFENGEIDGRDRPAEVHDQYKVTFGKFLPNIFASHFRKIKKMMREKSTDFETPSKKIDKASSAAKRDISKLLGNLDEDGVEFSHTTTPVKSRKYDDEEEYDEVKEGTVKNENDPVVICSFREGSDKKIGVLATMPSGTTHHVWNFIGGEKNGSTNIGEITFDWGKSSFDPNWAFKDEIKKGFMTENDPMIYAMQNLLHGRESVNESYPKGRILIKLPKLVQISENSYEKKVIKGIPEDHPGRKGYVGVLIKLVFSEIQEKEYKKVSPMILDFD